MDESAPQRSGHARSISTNSRHVSRLSRGSTTSGTTLSGGSSDMMPPLRPTTADDAFDSPPSSFGGRSTRSLSSTSRNSNRLSLTLPIGLPTNAPSRPTPISTTIPSFPSTPADTPDIRSPTENANDFIHAIAAQERKVLELREDLKNAEAELSRLKRQWSAFDTVRKRNAMVNGEPLRPTILNSPVVNDDVEGRTRSVELDRRRTMMMSQQQPTKDATPNSGRRRVMRGGHTRQLSLLSPTKPDGGFNILEDPMDCHKPPVRDPEPHFSLSRQPPLAANGISKRATWTPRSSTSSPATNNGVKQMAEDFKAGLWTFVEDLRQVTISNDPINGGSTSSGHRRVSGRQSEIDRDTIRASAASSSSRAHAANVFGNGGNDFSNTPTPTSRFSDPLRESDTANLGRPRPRTNSKKRAKHFSWTPLTVDSLDDEDWGNWESPTAATPSPRWSGTTVNGDIITTAIPEGKNDGNDLSKNNPAATPSEDHDLAPESPPLSAVRIEEMLRTLSPGNLKRATNEFLAEWEKSLGEPAVPIKDKAC